MLELRREGFRRCAIERQERKGKKHLNFCGNLKKRKMQSIECYSTNRRHDTRSGGYVYGGVKVKASASWLIALGLGCRASGSSFRRCEKLRRHTPHFMRIMSNNHPGVRQPKPHVPHVHPGEKNIFAISSQSQDHVCMKSPKLWNPATWYISGAREGQCISVSSSFAMYGALWQCFACLL